MKKKTIYRCLAGMLAVALPMADVPVVKAAGSVSTPNSNYKVLRDANGNVYDLGGMEIVIRDWWSTGETWEPENQYEAAQLEYWDWIQKTYNFKITSLAISDWESAPADFIAYVTAGGDEHNYAFQLRDDPAMAIAARAGLMYDLNSLNCLDFTADEYQRNKTHEQYSFDGKIFAMSSGYSEPRTGIWFNKRLLKEAGINPDSIYDMQAKGTWTWKAWTDLMAKVQKDTDGDGVIDVFGFDANYGVPVSAAVYSNGSEYVGLENGKYVYKFEDPATVEALEWISDTMTKYAVTRPASAQWDYYRQAFIDGQCAFVPDDVYMGDYWGMMDDEVGFVMFPKGPKASDYVNCWSNNPVVIPACYDAERAWKIAFAYDLYNADVPGYEGYVDNSFYSSFYHMDSRSVNETVPMMQAKGMVTYHSVIDGLDMGSPFLWQIEPGMGNITEILANNRDAYKQAINEANQPFREIETKSFYIDEMERTEFIYGLSDVNALNPNLVVTLKDGSEESIMDYARLLKYGISHKVVKADGTKAVPDQYGQYPVGTYRHVFEKTSTGESVSTPFTVVEKKASLIKSFRAELNKNYIFEEGRFPTNNDFSVEITTTDDETYYIMMWDHKLSQAAGISARVTDAKGKDVTNESKLPVGDYTVSVTFDKVGTQTFHFSVVSIEQLVEANVTLTNSYSTTGREYLDPDGYYETDPFWIKVTIPEAGYYKFTIKDEYGNSNWFNACVYTQDFHEIADYVRSCNFTKPGDYYVSIRCYTSNEIEVSLEQALMPKNIELESLPEKGLRVAQGSYFDSNILGDVMVRINYADGTSEVVPFTNEKCSDYGLEYSLPFYDRCDELGDYLIAVYNTNGINVLFDTLPFTVVPLEEMYPEVFPGTPVELEASKSAHWMKLTYDGPGFYSLSANNRYINLYDDFQGEYIMGSSDEIMFPVDETTQNYWISVYAPGSNCTVTLQKVGIPISGLGETITFEKSSWNEYEYFAVLVPETGTYKLANANGADDYNYLYFDSIGSLGEEPLRTANNAYVNLEEGTWYFRKRGDTGAVYLEKTKNIVDVKTISVMEKRYEYLPVNGGHTDNLELEITYEDGKKKTVKAYDSAWDFTYSTNSDLRNPDGSFIQDWNMGGEYVYNINLYGMLYHGYSYPVKRYAMDENPYTFTVNRSTTLSIAEELNGTNRIYARMDIPASGNYTVLASKELQFISIYQINGTYGWNGVSFDINTGSKCTFYAPQAGVYYLGIAGRPEDLNTVITLTDGAAVQSVQKLNNPKNLSANAGSAPDLTGLKVRLTFDDNTTKDVTYGSSDWNKYVASIKATGISGAAAGAPTTEFNDTLFKVGTYKISVEFFGAENAVTFDVNILTADTIKITEQPANKSVVDGKTAAFSVKASGTGLTYQWQFKAANATKWTNSGIASAKTANMAFIAYQSAGVDGRQYRCVITDAYGVTKTTDIATLSVREAGPYITAQPENQSGRAGDIVTFSVVAEGDGLTYQWRYRNKGVTTWTNSGIRAAKTANMTFAVGTDKTINGRQYQCVITDKDGIVKESAIATFTIQVKDPVITSQPVDTKVIVGNKVTFSVKAEGDGLQYQWQYKDVNAADWANSGATVAKTANMSFSATSTKLNGRQYRCIITGESGKTVTTNAVTLTVREAGPYIESQPVSVSNVVAGDTVTFSVVADGEGLSYQWQYRNAGATTWTNSGIRAAKTANMTFAAGIDKTLNGRQYQCIITDVNGKSVTTNVATLTMKSNELVIKTQPTNVTAASGAKATFSVVAEGEGLTYQWQYKNNGAADWVKSGIAAAKTANMSFTVGTDKTLNGRQYQCIITDANGKSVTTNAVTLYVSGMGAVIKTQPTNVTAAAGAKATFSVVAEGEGLSYQWQYRNAGATTWSKSGIAAAKTANMSFTVGTDKTLNGRQYQCVITDASGKTVTTNVVTLSVQ